MKAWDEVPPPIPPARHHHVTFDAAALRDAPPLERLVGIWLDAGPAVHGQPPVPSTVLVEGDRWFATDPDYPGGFMAETTPEHLVPWSSDAERDLARIAALVVAEARDRTAELGARIRRAAESVAVGLVSRCTGPADADVLYDVRRCAAGERPVPCERSADAPGVVAEVTGNASIVPSRWPGRWLVAETDANRALLVPFADRVRRALTTAERLGSHAASATGALLIHDYLAGGQWPDARQTPREPQIGPQLEDAAIHPHLEGAPDE